MKTKIYKILDESDAKVLATKCTDVDVNSDVMHNVAHELHNTMVSSPKKLAGLAAPQIGHTVRMLIMKWGDGLIMLVNPIIVKSSDKTYNYKEGCASCPDSYLIETKRSKSVVVEYYDMLLLKRTKITLKCRDAVIVQHEIDHLDGICIWDARSKAGIRSLEIIEEEAKAKEDVSKPADMLYKNGKHKQSVDRIKRITK